MKYKCRLSQLLTSLFIGILLPSSASAYVVYGGTKNIKVGESVTLETEPNTYYTVTGSWSKEGNSCYFSKKSNRSCEVTGSKAGETTVRWIGVVGSADYEYYWYINVSGESPVPIPEPDPEPDPEPVPAPETSWEDSYDISWYNKSNDTFILSTNEELAGIAYLVNNGYTTFKGKTIKLGNDIDLSGKRWTTIATSKSQPFEGSFDGQNHTISGIYITLQNSKQEIYGFFGVYEGTSILNTIFKGEIDIKYPDFENDDSEWDIGGIAGRISSSTTISHCVSDMDISFKISKSSNIVNIGGVCGKASGFSKIRYCSHIGIFDIGDHDKLLSNSMCVMIGGIVGQSNNCVIEMCENISSRVLCYVEPHRNSGWKLVISVGIGGISGSGGKTSYCRSIIDEIGVANESYGNNILLYLGGINGGITSNPNIINCYSVINNVKLIKGELWSGGGGVFYGGINAKTSGSSYSKANFSNSDYSIDLPDWISIDAESGDNGDDSFTSEQMKTDNFLKQLNTYSILEEGKGVWTTDENGYPCIEETHSLLPPEPIDKGIAINESNFPDYYFRKYLLEQDYGKDGVITDEEINGITSISIFSDVSNLKGIEFFENLEHLSIDSDKLTSLDVSKHTALYQLHLYSEKLKSNVLEIIISTLPLNFYTKRHDFVVGGQNMLSSQLIDNTRKQGWTPCYMDGVTSYKKYPGDNPTGINLTESSLAINIGEAYIMGYTMTPSSSVRDVTWDSDDTSIASIDYEGVIRGYKQGTTYIRATTPNGITGSCKVTVSDPSSIQNIKMGTNLDVPIYNLNGQRLDKPRKGINIIRGKKVVIK